MTYGLSSDAKEIIAAHQSRNRRQAERIAVLEGLVQSTNAERDMYAEHAAAFEAERDQARAIAVELEQQLAAIQAGVNELHRECDRVCLEEYGAGPAQARLRIVDVQELIASVTGGES